MKVRKSGVYGIEIRNVALDGGRMDVSLDVKKGATPGASARENEREAKRRAAAVHLMVERGEWRIIRDLRSGAFSVVDLANAVRDGAIDSLRRVGEQALTLGSMVERVLTEKRATQQKGTIKHYEKVCRSLLDEWGEDADLTQVTTDQARSWLYRKRGGRAWAANTQAGYLMVAAYVWRTAIDLEMETSERLKVRPRMTRNLWNQVEPAGERTRRHAFLEPSEWNDLLAKVQGRPEAALLALCCLAGLRMQEALHLRTGLDVDFDAEVIRIQPRQGEYAWDPKGDNSVRDVPMTKALRAVLENHAEKFAGVRYFIRSSRGDRPLSYTRAKSWVQTWFTAAGLEYGRGGEGLTAHSLRHTFASWLVREGWSSTLVAKLMGNTSREVERTYAHLQRGDLQRVVGTIDDLVFDTVRPLKRPVRESRHTANTRETA